MTITELRDKRANLWKSMTAFLDTRTGSDGVLSAEDDASYAKMEKDFDALTNEIKRMERKEALEAEMNKPVGTPITEKPMKAADDEEKTGRASKAYNKSFWNAMRQKNILPEIANALQEGTDSEGGYLVPDEFEHTLVEALESENIFRTLAHVIQTASGDRKIPVVATKGTASWVDEEGSITESDDSFTQVSIGAYKLGTLIKVSNELLRMFIRNSVTALTVVPSMSVPPYARNSSSSMAPKSSLALRLPPRGSPSLTFWMLPRPQAIPLLPLELKA